MDKKSLRFKCQKTGECQKCGECCSFKEKRFLRKDEDLYFREKIYEKTGLVYIDPLYSFTITVTPEEKIILEKKAKALKLELKLKPKRLSYNPEKDNFNVLDYTLVHDRCPFQKEDNSCMIYKFRPIHCREFPHINFNNMVLEYPKNDKSDFGEIIKIAKKNIRKEKI
ncbi:MAG: YkgJ family cysteine cluster protein [Candidatus Woesearchaeota archaeon]